MPELHADQRIRERLHRRRSEILVRFRIFPRHLSSQIDKFCVRLIESNSRFEPTHNRRRGVVGTDDELAAGYRRKLIVKRRPEFLEIWELKILRHNADDCCRLAINSNVLSDDVGIAVEIPFPNFVTENDGPFRTRFVVLGGEVASKNRRYTSDLKKVLGDVTTGITLRIVLVGNVYCRPTEVASHQGARLLDRFQIFVILRCRNYAEPEVVVLIGRFWIDQPNGYQLLRMRKRKPAQHDSIDDGKLSGRTADTESENEHGQKTKGFVFEQNTQPDSNVLPK